MPSDLGREHRFAADVGVKEELGVWQEGAHAVQPTNGKRGAFQQALPVSGEIEGRLRRDRGAAPARSRVGSGGSGNGTKALTVSPPVAVVS